MLLNLKYNDVLNLNKFGIEYTKNQIQEINNNYLVLLTFYKLSYKL